MTSVAVEEIKVRVLVDHTIFGLIWSEDLMLKLLVQQQCYQVQELVQLEVKDNGVEQIVIQRLL
jgi:hypothetical protein